MADLKQSLDTIETVVKTSYTCEGFQLGLRCAAVTGQGGSKLH